MASSLVRDEVVRSLAMTGSLAQGPFVELREVRVVGGELGVAGRVDPRPLIEDDGVARLVLVRVAAQLLADQAEVEQETHPAVERPLQRVAPVDRPATGLG